MPIIPYLKRLFQRKKPLIIVCGPTATGKTALGIELAKKHDGEVISADSRQVYRGLDIGTAKVTLTEMDDIPHHMIDIVDPDQVYSVAQYQRDATEVIADVHARGKLPILVGGTGMYIQAIVDGVSIPQVPPNPKLRQELEQLDTRELFAQIKGLDPIRALEIDPHNRRRLIRAIEIATDRGNVPPLKKSRKYRTKTIYLDLPDVELQQRIHDRNVSRLPDLINEVQGLSLPKERLEDLGLEYRYTKRFLDGEIESEEKLIEILDTKTWQFAKRQRTWFKKYGGR